MSEKLNMDEETDWREWVESDFLAGWEVKKTGNLDVTISNIITDGVYSPKDKKKVDTTILHFTEGKPMILNKINRKSITVALKTPIMQKWIGQSITLTTEYGSWFGQPPTDALRVSTTPPTPAKVDVLAKPILKKDSPEYNKVVTFLKAQSGVGFEEAVKGPEGKYKISATLRAQLQKEHEGSDK